MAGELLESQGPGDLGRGRPAAGEEHLQKGPKEVDGRGQGSAATLGCASVVEARDRLLHWVALRW